MGSLGEKYQIKQDKRNALDSSYVHARCASLRAVGLCGVLAFGRGFPELDGFPVVGGGCVNISR